MKTTGIKYQGRSGIIIDQLHGWYKVRIGDEILFLSREDFEIVRYF